MSTGSWRASRATNSAPPRSGPTSASAARHSSAIRATSASVAGRAASVLLRSRLELADPAEDGLAAAVPGFVCAHCFELVVGQTGETLHHLRRREGVIAG